MHMRSIAHSMICNSQRTLQTLLRHQEGALSKSLFLFSPFNCPQKFTHMNKTYLRGFNQKCDKKCKEMNYLELYFCTPKQHKLYM